MGPGASVDGNPLNVFAEVIYEDLPGALAWLPDAFGFVPGRLARNAEGTVIWRPTYLGTRSLSAASASSSTSWSEIRTPIMATPRPRVPRSSSSPRT